MMIAKWDASKRRNPLAHPHISEAGVRKFLKELGDEPQDVVRWR
jgi:hypothetical protein